MSKSADYFISKVSYNTNHTRIVYVKQHVVHDGNKFDDGVVASRSTVVSNLNTSTYMTIIQTTNSWNVGDKVIRYLIDGEYFIRTDGNKTKSDNLGELPEF